MFEMEKKRVYLFGGSDRAEGHGKMRELLGGKGAGLAEMSRIGLGIPAGFTITTEVCAHYIKGGEMPSGLEAEVEEALQYVEKAMGARFGHPENPLLVSVRSGARSCETGIPPCWSLSPSLSR